MSKIEELSPTISGDSLAANALSLIDNLDLRKQTSVPEKKTDRKNFFKFLLESHQPYRIPDDFDKMKKKYPEEYLIWKMKGE